MCAVNYSLWAQDNNQFRNFQFSSGRVTTAWKKYDDSLKQLFVTNGLAWPPSDIYLRAFKTQNEMELWARDNEEQEYRHLRNYPICAMSGALGPKRQIGDRQVPEGFYFIEDFNPNSNYLLSMLVNYPNYADQLKAGPKNKDRLGGDIYIHGGCVTVGCLPMNDEGISELYTLCLNAKMNGQEYIPVHIYPTRMNKIGLEHLITDYKDNREKQEFWASLKGGYDYFETHHKLLPVMYLPDGTYTY